MTTATINEKRVTMTIEDKAHGLQVFEIGEEYKLAVTSGSELNKAYVVTHNGSHVTHCPCKAYTSRCCHAVAGTWHLEAKNRAAYCEMFSIYN